MNRQGAPRVSAKLWRRACLWVTRSRGNPFVQLNPRTSGYCAGYLAALRDVAKKKNHVRKLARMRRDQLELFGSPDE